MPQAYMPSVAADVLPDAGPFVVPAGVELPLAFRLQNIMFCPQHIMFCLPAAH